MRLLLNGGSHLKVCFLGNEFLPDWLTFSKRLMLIGWLVKAHLLR